MNIAEILEQTPGQENELYENDWYFLYCQCQVLCQVLVLKNIH